MASHYPGFNSSTNTDRHGFKKPEEFDEAGYEEFVSNYLPVLEKRSTRWDSLITTTPSSPTLLPQGIIAERKLKRFIRKGVPIPLRPRVWSLVSGANEREEKHPGEYRRLCKTTAAKEASHAIDLDLNRTFPDNEYFRDLSGRTKNELKDVLHALAVKHSEIGYCQGLNYIAGMLLLVMKSPEKAYWLLESVIVDIPDYYTPLMKGLKIDIMVLHHLIRDRAPDLDACFKKYDFDLLLVTSKWYLCWYMETLPIETVLRVWDCMFHEGPKILFRVALTLILNNKQRFLRCTSMGAFMEVAKTITQDQRVVNCHKFMEDIFVVPGSLSGKTIAQLRSRYSTQVK